jgi:formylglycine-generating enzyme required for sulfatase activity
MQKKGTHIRGYLRLAALAILLVAGWQEQVVVADGPLDPHEVTNAQYARFIAATGREPPPHWPHGAPPMGQAGEPVVMVTWHDAVAYCAWDGHKKLPAVAEWQGACQAGTLHKLGDVWEWTATDAQGGGRSKILCGPRGTCACSHVYDPAWRNMVKGFRCGGAQPMAFID